MPMRIQTRTVRFDGQTFYLGVDVHKRNWRVTIRNNNLWLKTFSMNPSPVALSDFMQKHYPGGNYRSVYEAGFCGYWIHREMTRLGFENIIVNPADVPSTNKEKDRKDDPIDSNKLSRELGNHSLNGIYVPNEQQEAMRSVSRLYRQYSERNVQIKNRIKGFLAFIGQPIPVEYEESRWSFGFIHMLKTIPLKNEDNRMVLSEHVAELEHVRTRQSAVLRKIRALSKGVPTIAFLRTIPGIGIVTSFVLFTELVDIHRFHKLDHLCSFIGLVPSTASSGATVRVNGITPRHNKFLRYLIIEAAWIAVRKDPAMTAAYNELTKRMTKQRAIVRIAKKLTNRIRYVWLHQKEYVPSIVE
jgi:transposase